MRTLFLFMAVLGVALLVAAGTAPVMAAGPGIEWQQLLGGNGSEIARSVNLTADGGCILVGETYSSQNGDVTGINRGGSDIWLVKLDSTGAVAGKRLIGGSGDEYGYFVQQTVDGGYIVIGDSTSSTSWDVTGVNQDLTGLTADVWVVKLDAVGAIQRQFLLGGTGDDHGRCVHQTTDGGYILVGDTTSPFLGDPPLATHGGSDIWVARLDAAGGLLWFKPLGGSGNEYGYSVQQTADGGFVILGDSKSATITEDGITDANHDPSGATSDIWVVKLGPGGATQTHMLLGGASSEIGRSIQQTTDLGYILLGESRSSESGDVTGANHGTTDIWVVRLGPAGGILQQRLLGGSLEEQGNSVRQTADGGYIVLGTAYSYSITEGGVTEDRHGGGGRDYPDYWVVKLGPGGLTQWHDLLGSGGYDEGYSVLQSTDGGYILAGRAEPSSDPDGDVHGPPHGYADCWVVKLYADAPAVLAVPPSMLVPTDTNADGKYEDVNGNGRKDFADVVLYFNQMTWIAAYELVSLFDYNGNTRIDFADVVWLFNTI